MAPATLPSLGRATKKLFESIKLHPSSARAIALTIRVNPSVLSRVMRGYQPANLDNPQWGKLAKLLGCKLSDLFEPWNGARR